MMADGRKLHFFTSVLTQNQFLMHTELDRSTRSEDEIKEQILSTSLHADY